MSIRRTPIYNDEGVFTGYILEDTSLEEEESMLVIRLMRFIERMLHRKARDANRQKEEESEDDYSLD